MTGAFGADKPLDPFFAVPYPSSLVFRLFSMPITSSAIKAARQSEARRIRRLPPKTHLKTVLRSFTDLVKEGKKAEAANMLPKVYKAIDMSVKKHLIHRNTAARKKSSAARMVR